MRDAGVTVYTMKEIDRVCGDPAHGSLRVTWGAGMPGERLARPSKLLDRRGRGRPAASKATHVSTIALPSHAGALCNLFGISWAIP